MNGYLVLIYRDGEVYAAAPTSSEESAKLIAIIAMHDEENERAEVYVKAEISEVRIGYLRIGVCVRGED